MKKYLYVGLVSVFVLVGLIAADSAFASRTVTSVTLDSVSMSGSNSIIVGGDKTISAQINVTNDSDSDWESTGWRISTTAPGSYNCVNHTDHNSNGSHSETFNIDSPSGTGTYDVYFRAFSNDSCSDGSSGSFSHNDGVVVNLKSITSATVDGASSVTVAPNSLISTVVKITASGSGFDNDWGSTLWLLSSTSSSPISCVNTSPNSNVAGNFTSDPFNITAPSIPGVYNLYLIAAQSNNSSCSGAKSPLFTLSNAVTVLEPDVTPPDTTITSTPANPSNSGSAVFEFISTEAGTFECQMDGEGFSSCVTPKTYAGLLDGSHTFEVQAKDLALNVDPTPASYAWTIDTIPPTLHLPEDIIMEATGFAGEVITYTATADDVDPLNPIVNCVPPSGSTFVLGATMVSCSATDATGNTAAGSFQITIQDTTIPVITAPVDQTFEADGTLTTPILVLATAEDIADPNPVVTYSPSSFPLGTTVVTWRATDSSGNFAETTSSVTIVDTTPPVITLNGNNPFDMYINTDYLSLNPDPDFSAVDVVDGDLTGSVVVTGKDFDNTILGSHVITYSVTDSNGNKSEITRTVNVVDRNKPIIYRIGGSPLTVEGGSAYADAGATAVDRDGSNITSSIVVVNPVNTSVLGSYTITYDVTGAELGDLTGTNMADQAKRIVNVVDTTAPTITVDPGVVNIFVGDTYTDSGVSASDIIDGDVTPLIVRGGTYVNTLTAGTYTITYDVVDSSGNHAIQVTRTININEPDTTDPSITSVRSTDANTIEVLFDEELQNENPGHHPNPSDFNPYNDLDDSGSFTEGDLSYGIGSDGVSYENKKVTITLTNPIKSGDKPRLFINPMLTSLVDLTGNFFNHGASADLAVSVVELPAPIISGETSSSITQTSVTITWVTDHLATSRVVYDVTSHNPITGEAPNYGYASSTVEQDTDPMVTNHSVIISGLSAGTTYYFRAVSHGSPEAVGNEVIATTQSVQSSGGGGGGGGTPYNYSMVINSGAEKTSTIAVTLNMSATVAPGKMMISNTSDFSGASWENYAVTKNWTLSSDNGTKIVYVKFSNDGSNTISSANDSIILEVLGGSGALSQETGGGEVLGVSRYYFKVNFGFGSKGIDVSELQKRLIEEGFFKGGATGYFGTATLAAVKEYQKKNGIPQTGYVGSLTRAKLNGSEVAGVSTESVDSQINQLRQQLLNLLQQLLLQLQNQKR